jgi:D-alanyl-lipoteichoic acid acyltransferase DltB (MBOAT superfamily)
MLFNSPIFIFAFLPITLTVFYLVGRFSTFTARVWLSGASLFFYGWWNPAYLILIVGSIVLNFYFARVLQRYDEFALLERYGVSKKTIVIAGIALNVLILLYFKYFAFLIRNANAFAGTGFNVPHIILPLAISFFTFQKIAYLVDSYQGKAREDSFLNFLLFVSFFPQLIAGPIVHYSELLPQLREDRIYKFDAQNFSNGLSYFLLGLAKKAVLADAFATYCDPAFFGAAQGAQLDFTTSWTAALSYTLQLYFDFSGYSDMALGLALMMNVKLPINFFSPYKATSIIDFWRRWHITLSRFLREYIYIPLGGNRRGRICRYVNLMVTMLIGGAWHGANWTFVAWGGAHGAFLSINHFWNSLTRGRTAGRMGRVLSHFLTLLCVVLAWVLFRADSIATAGTLYGGMLGRHGFLLPQQVISLAPPLSRFFTAVGNVPYLGNSSVMGVFEIVVMLIAGFAIVLGASNLYQLSYPARLALVGLSFAFTLQKVLFASAISPFIYFQF